jgi:hypothetical protein
MRLLRLLFVPPSQPYTGTTTVLVDEFDARNF